MASYRFTQVDVFTATALLGNPVAVVFDAHTLSDEQMQAIARWTNLSETTFVLPATLAEAQYRLRIFTPNAELPFAGHPTIGSAHAALELGVVQAQQGHLVQQCAVGAVHLTVDAGAGMIFLKLPTATVEMLGGDTLSALSHALGAAPSDAIAIVSVGPRWLIAEIASSEQLLAMEPDANALTMLSRRHDLCGVTVFSRDPEHIEVRSFAPAMGIAEDPVCGSGNGCVAAFLRATGQSVDYIAHQGQKLGRKGVVAIRYGPDQSIFLGGQAVSCVRGTLNV